MDDDLDGTTRDNLAREVQRLRNGIREHCDRTGHRLCWHQPALRGFLPERIDPLPTVPTWPVFLQGCLHYRASLDAQAPDAPRSEKPYQDEDE